MRRHDLQEQLAALYLRLNGYLVSGFIVHAQPGGKETNRTQVDALGVRFPYSCEPEREIKQSVFLQIPDNVTDILICEVKGGKEALKFNERLRKDSGALRSVLRWIGAFTEDEINGLVPAVQKAIRE